MESLQVFTWKKNKSCDILRNFLVVLAQSCNHSLYLKEVDPVGCYRFSQGIYLSFNLPFDV